MNRFILIILMCFFTGLSEATFELEDPAEPGKRDIEETGKPLFKGRRGDNDVIVAAGTSLYAPVIENRRCEGWQADESEPSANHANGTQSTTANTYLGTLVRKVDCQGDHGSKQFSVISLDDGRLIWVESDKVLTAD